MAVLIYAPPGFTASLSVWGFLGGLNGIIQGKQPAHRKYLIKVGGGYKRQALEQRGFELRRSTCIWIFFFPNKDRTVCMRIFSSF